jgi:O-antigen/teichoic acid export membrane protein
MVRFGDHVGRGTWALAEKALVPLYGAAVVVMAIRILPRQEIAVYGILQSMFLLLQMASMTLVFRPMVKYVAERRGEASVTATATALGLAVMVGPALLLFVSSPIWGEIFHSESLAASMWVLVPLAVVTVPRTATVELLKAQYQTRGMFFLSAVYWLGSLAGLVGLALSGRLSSAIDILLVNCAAGVLSAVVAGRYLLPLLSRGCFTRPELLRLLQFGRFSFSTGVGNYLLSEADLWVVGLMLGPQMLGLYTAARIIIRRAYGVGAQFLETIVLPKTSHLASRGRLKEVAVLYEKVVCFYSMLLVPTSILLLVFARQFLDLIYGGRHLEATLPLQLLVAGGLTWPLRGVGASLLHGMGRPRDVLSRVLLVLPIHWALTLGGVQWLGLIGAPLAVAFSRALLAWLLTRRVASLIETSPARVIWRTRDAWHFLISRLERMCSPRSSYGT